MCIPFFHDWEVLRVEHYKDDDYYPDDRDNSSAVYMRCVNCGKLKTDWRGGEIWNMEDFE